MRKIILARILLTIALLSFASNCTLAKTPEGDTHQEATSLPSQTLVSPTDPNIRDECLYPVSVEKLPGIKGTIATFDVKTNDVSLWDLEANRELILGKIEILTGVLSTDQKLAYIDSEIQKIIVVSTQGEKLATIPAAKNWVEILGWADGENLIVSNMPFRNDGGWSPPSSTTILNIASGEYIEVFPKYPNIYPYTSGPPNFGRYSYSITAYDSTLTRVVYPGITETDFFIALWDVINNRELVRLQLPSSYYPPQWKQDGKSFVVSAPPEYRDSKGNIHKNASDQSPYVGGNELFSVGRDGEIKRLTYLTSKYSAEESEYIWSPSGKLVAFWLKEDDNSGWQLAVLNRDTGVITNYCVGGGDGSFPIIWSPDESQIISTTINEENSDPDLILVRLDKKLAYIIHKSEIALGWMDK